MKRIGRNSLGMLGLILALASPGAGIAAQPAPSDVLVTVNGRSITAADLESLFLLRRIPKDQQQDVREQFLQELIDRKLIEAFLETRQTKADPKEVDLRIQSLRQLIERGSRDPDEVFAAVGITEQMLRDALALPLAWMTHVREVVTEEQLQEYFRENQARLDGTRVRASQIVRVLPAKPERDEMQEEEAAELLLSLKQRIEAGETTFAQAAREHSQSPSAAKGGDLGWLPQPGALPESVQEAALSLQPGEISQPLISPFGVHLVKVTDTQPGDLSLEDVRGEVLKELAEQMWNERVAEERMTAEIVRVPNVKQ